MKAVVQDDKEFQQHAQKAIYSLVILISDLNAKLYSVFQSTKLIFDCEPLWSEKIKLI